MTQIELLQKRSFENKIKQGFTTKDVKWDFLLLYEEVAEAFEAYRTKKDTLGSELADVFIFLLGIAEMCDLNLSEEVERKMTLVEEREYVVIDGVRIRKDKCDV